MEVTGCEGGGSHQEKLDEVRARKIFDQSLLVDLLTRTSSLSQTRQEPSLRLGGNRSKYTKEIKLSASASDRVRSSVSVFALSLIHI
eukprot:753612-Rhodomonas_salina.4